MRSAEGAGVRPRTPGISIHNTSPEREEIMKQGTTTMSGSAAATERQSSKFLSQWCAVIAILLTITTAAWAQDNASLTGTVMDPSGAAVVNAGISLTNTATGQVRHATSNSAGDYLFASLGAGIYNLEASASGFQKFSRTGIVVHVAQTLQQNVDFKVGNTQETVTVEADALQ